MPGTHVARLAGAEELLVELLTLAQAGFAGVNLHGGLGICGAPLYNGKFQRYTPLCAANEEDLRANALGAKGIGEIGITGTAAAVASAVHNATGIRVRDLPITPDRLLR